MVRFSGYMPCYHAKNETGVDACNTFIEVILFAGAMNLGQSWKTVLTLFACKIDSDFVRHCF